MVINKKAFPLSLTEVRREKLVAIAKKKEKTLTAIINDAIDNYIEQQDTKKSKSPFDMEVDANFKLGGETNLWG
jgi:hypothetical protein